MQTNEKNFSPKTSVNDDGTADASKVRTNDRKEKEEVAAVVEEELPDIWACI